MVDIYPSDYGHAQELETSIETAAGGYIGLELVDSTKIPDDDVDMVPLLHPKYNPKSLNFEPIIISWNE